MNQAASFSLPDQTGKIRSLSDYGGMWLIVYFYPRDDTPGCTIEACSFRDEYSLLLEKGLNVVGISRDSVVSHKKFAEKYHLNFPLLADTTGDIAAAYGAKSTLGVKRMTYLINPKGEVMRRYDNVTPQTHVAEILSDYAALRKD